MKYSQRLQRLGFSEAEAIVYEALLNNGPMNIVSLSGASNIHRPGLYLLLPKMISKDLVVEIKKGKRVEYVATPPSKLEPLVKNAQNSLDNIISNLNFEYSKRQIVPRIETYYGKEGIARVFMDIVTTLNKGETFYRYSIRKDIYKDYLPKAYRQLRDEKKLERLAIANEEGAKRKHPKLDRFVKILKGDYENFNVNKIIYQSKIAFVDYENEVAFIIFNDRMAKMEKEVFLKLYKML